MTKMQLKAPILPESVGDVCHILSNNIYPLSAYFVPGCLEKDFLTHLILTITSCSNDVFSEQIKQYAYAPDHVSEDLNPALAASGPKGLATVLC